MRLFKNARYEFIDNRKKAYTVSGAIIGVGILAMIVNVFAIGNFLNFGVDFTGGTLVQVRFDGEVTAADVRAALGGSQAPSITRFGAENEFTIRAPLPEDTGNLEIVSRDIRAQLDASGLGSYEVVRTELVGPKIGEELTRQSAIAIILATILILLYLAFRFELRFGLASTASTVHDVLITLGFLAIFRVEISLPMIAAVLTVVGYSMNDTVVLFDRIRENMNKKGGRREDPIRLIDRSINEVLPRTVITAVTTLTVLVALLVLGGAVTRDFASVLILGVVVGTYSSVFLAAPALIEIERRWKRRGDRKTSEERARDAADAAIPV